MQKTLYLPVPFVTATFTMLQLVCQSQIPNCPEKGNNHHFLPDTLPFTIVFSFVDLLTTVCSTTIRSPNSMYELQCVNHKNDLHNSITMLLKVQMKVNESSDEMRVH